MKAKEIFTKHRKIVSILSIITVLWAALITVSLFVIGTSRANVIDLEAMRAKEHYERVLSDIFFKFETIKVFTETVGVDNLTEDAFDDFASISDFSDIGFVSFSIAPDGVMAYYYSEIYETSLIGLDLVNDERDHVREAVEYAITNHVIVIDGPFLLLQGGEGMVFRRAIYEDGEFAAIINLVINQDQLAALFNSESSTVVNVGVYKTDDTLIFGTLPYADELMLLERINLDNVDWRIGVEVSNSFRQASILTNSLLLSLSILLYMFGMFYAVKIYKRNRVLYDAQELMIHFDNLTGLPNRRHLTKDVEQMIRNNQAFYLGFGDLDNFKMLNDIMGHSIGDEYLQTISKRLNTVIDKTMQIYRWGGDEFIVIIKSDDKDIARNYFDSVYRTLEVPVEIRDVDYSISISIGIVSYPRHGITMDDLIKRADIVMYDIKSTNKNTYNFFENRYLDNLQRQVDFDNKISRFSMEDFQVYLQPILNVETNAIYGFEALTRLFDENGKPFNTIDVIKVLERKGQIPQLDQHVFETLCIMSQKMKAEFKQDFCFSFNVSPLTLSEEFVQFLKETIEKYSLEPKHFIFEIIETIGFKELNEAVTLLKELKEVGFQIAMDDFGMGYSSLSYIAKLPLSMIKIDRYFINNYYDNELDRLLIFAIRDISRSLKLEIVVEGIETSKQLEFIKKIGANYYQGYIHSRPMKLKDLMKKMKEGF